jgi:hypothetical protein
MTEQLKVTSPEEIAEKTKTVFEAEATDPGELVTLPKTGIVVRLRRTDMEGEALTGGLPLSLVSAARGVAENDGDENDGGEQPARETTPEEDEQNAKALIFFRQMVVENCLEPKIGQDVAGRVCFMGKDNRAVARVHKTDFLFMFQWISGQEGNDGMKKFRNRKTRRTSAAQSRRKTLRAEAINAPESEPASA